MILSFSFPEFEHLIKTGIKRFTIREDKHNRWRNGMKIHFWMGSPRNPSKNPYLFGEGICNRVDHCLLSPRKNFVKIYSNKSASDFLLLNNSDLLDEFAVEDGFKSWKHLKEWFEEDFEGRIIRWEPSRFIFY